MECLKDYKNCMSVLIPTVPPFVVSLSTTAYQYSSPPSLPLSYVYVCPQLHINTHPHRQWMKRLIPALFYSTDRLQRWTQELCIRSQRYPRQGCLLQGLWKMFDQQGAQSPIIRCWRVCPERHGRWRPNPNPTPISCKLPLDSVRMFSLLVNDFWFSIPNHFSLFSLALFPRLRQWMCHLLCYAYRCLYYALQN